MASKADPFKRKLDVVPTKISELVLTSLGIVMEQTVPLSEGS